MYSSFHRFTHIIEELEKVHASIIHSPHWYLNFIAVDPLYQNKGYGTNLLTSMLRNVDSDGFHCYLEVWVKKNVEWY
jgi:ribosomal protein S18 acetylase RimI-like enzyme